MTMSVAGSYAESIFYEEPYTIPGPCKTACIRLPCPSFIATIYFVISVILFAVASSFAFNMTQDVFLNTEIIDKLSTWRLFMFVAVICWCAINVLLAVVMLSCGFLGTGATRKEFICRFKSRASGRCQTCAILLVALFLLLFWLALGIFMVLPVEFFSIQRQGACASCLKDVDGEYTLCEGDIDLRQWGFLPWDEIDGNSYIRNDQLVKLCNSPVLWWYCSAFAFNIIIILGMVHYIINFSANFAKLRDRFKGGYVDRRTGTYLVRSTSTELRGSTRSLRSRASVRNNTRTNQATANGHTPSTISTLQMAAYKNDALNASIDELSMTNMNHYNRKIMEDPPEYTATTYRYDRYGDEHQDETDLGNTFGTSYQRNQEDQDYRAIRGYGPSKSIPNESGLKNPDPYSVVSNGQNQYHSQPLLNHGQHSSNERTSSQVPRSSHTPHSSRESYPSREPFPSREPHSSRETYPSREPHSSRETYPSHSSEDVFQNRDLYSQKPHHQSQSGSYAGSVHDQAHGSYAGSVHDQPHDSYEGSVHNQPHGNHPSTLHSDPSSMQSQISHFRARQEYFI